MARTALLPALLLLIGVAACGETGTGPSVAGGWGGQAASLQLAPEGGVIQYQCGAGTIDSGWTFTKRGAFTAVGVHFFGGGPMPPEGQPGYPARYSGQLVGSRLTFTVTVAELNQVLGPFEVVRDGPRVANMCV